MAIVFKPELAIIMYIAAFILSIIPKRIFPNLILSIFDLIAVGSGEIAKKRYIDGILLSIISGLIYFLIYYFRDYYIATRPMMLTRDVPFMVNVIVIFGTFIFVLFYANSRGEEMDLEAMDRSVDSFVDRVNQQLAELSKKTGRPIAPITRPNLPRDRRQYTNIVGETDEERIRRDIEWQEEVISTQTRQVEMDFQQEVNDRFDDPFYN